MLAAAFSSSSASRTDGSRESRDQRARESRTIFFLDDVWRPPQLASDECRPPIKARRFQEARRADENADNKQNKQRITWKYQANSPLSTQRTFFDIGQREPFTARSDAAQYRHLLGSHQ